MSKVEQIRADPRRIGGIVAGLAGLLVGGILLVVFWPSPSPDVLWNEAKENFEGHRYAQAQALMDRVKKLRAPTDLDWMLRGQLAIVKNRTDEAIDDLTHVSDRHKMAAQARFEAGHLEIQRFRFIDAERYLLQALKLDPTMIKARRELVYVYGTQLRRNDIDANFRELFALTSLSYSEVFLWCLTRGVQWEAGEIVQTLDKCIKADPNDRYARLGQAEGLRALSRFDEAEAVLAPLPDSDPDARAARVRLARARADDELAESLLAAGPADHLGLTVLRGQFALARGNGPEALRQFQIAHKLAPKIRETVFGLGQSLQMTGDLVGAAPYLLQARNHERLNTLIQRASVQSNRDDPALIRDLGAACAAVGRVPEARAWYNLALVRDPLDTKVIQALTALDHLSDPPKGQ